jgi:predicted AlkP superfamily phosphohydrolase/phosphomutase
VLGNQSEPSPAVNANAKVLVVGLDAMEADLVTKWADCGDLPTLARLRREGVWGRPRGLPGFGSDANWMSFLTAVCPGRHGRYFYRQFEQGSYVARRPKEKSWNREPFWAHLGRSGKRCIAIDMPYGAVTEELNGIQVADWLVHDRIYPRVRSWPEDVADRLVKHHGRHEAHVHDLHGRSRGHYMDLVRHLKARVETKSKVALDFAASEAWDIFLVSFSDAHDVGHICWHLHDPSHPLHDPALAGEIGDPIKAVYAAIDRALGQLLDCVDESVTVLVYSGIGMGPNYGANFLFDDFLRVHEFGAAPPRRLVDGVRRAYRRTMPSVGRNLLLSLAAKTDERLVAQDRSRRRYFHVPHNEISGAVRINLKGRETNGRIEPGREYDRLCEDLASDLSGLVNADTGAPIVKEIIRTRATYSGPLLDALPDLLVVWNKAEPLTAMGLDGVGSVRADYPGNRTGDHTSNIFFAAIGPGIAPGQLTSTAGVMDFAPTIAAILGVDPADWDGSTIAGLLDGV